MIYNKIINLCQYYLSKCNSKEEIIEFRKQYEVIFDTFRNELLDEIGMQRYELLEKIYLIFDLYEDDENIRENENYCIDETSLIEKIKSILPLLLN